MKKLSIVFLALLLVFSFVSCDNETPVPDSGSGTTIPTPNKGDITTELFDKVNSTMALIDGASANEKPLTYNSSASGYAYDSNDKLIFEAKVTSIGDGGEIEGIATFHVDGKTFKNGQSVNFKSSDEEGSLINGEIMTQEQQEDLMSILSKASYFIMKTKTETTWNSISIGDQSYTLTKTMGGSVKMDDIVGESTGTESYFYIASLDKTYDGISYIAIYYDRDVTGKLSNGVCEVRGDSNDTGIYSIPQNILDSVTEN